METRVGVPGEGLNATTTVCCDLCGLPLQPGRSAKVYPHRPNQFCCYGCYLASSITGQQGEEGAATLFLARLALAAFLAMNVMTFTWALYGESLWFLFPVEKTSRQYITYLNLVLSVPVYLLLGISYLKNATRELSTFAPGVDSLIAIGTTSAFLYSIYSTLTGSLSVYYDTATMVLVLVTFGRYLEANAKLKSSAVLRALIAHQPVKARVAQDGHEVSVTLEQVHVGDRVRVLPGEIIPVDGQVLEGETSVNESLITGESIPVHKRRGDSVLGGTTNYEGFIEIEARRIAGEMLYQKLVDLMRQVQMTRSPVQQLADRISRVFIPIVLVLALITIAYWTTTGTLARGLLNGLSVLLIACPCALGIGATLAASIGHTRMAKSGILLKSLGVLEQVAVVETVFIDKTGTVTNGEMQLSGILPVKSSTFTPEEATGMAASLETRSEHPLGKAIVNYANELALPSYNVLEAKSIPGIGVLGLIEGGDGAQLSVRILKKTHTDHNKISNSLKELTFDKTSAYLYINNILQCIFFFDDSIRSSASQAVEQLKNLGVMPVLLSGDGDMVVRATAEEVKIQTYYSNLSPQAKIAKIVGGKRGGSVAAMVGDGINDVPALASADLGISIGSGTDLSKQVADVMILGDDLRKIPWCIAYARRVMRTLRWNFIWAFGYNLIGMALAMGGLLQPVLAALAMVISSSLVIVNSSRVKNTRIKIT